MGEEARMDDISASNPLQPPPPPPPVEAPVWKVIVVAAIAAGIQFGWALQLSLLTPYVQLLGIPHTWAAYIWLCGPISGLIVQPIVGYYSDRCTSRFGRRRPFIAVGAIFVAVAVFLIGYAADIGHKSGDPSGKTIKIRAIVIFIVGFTTLDVANNMLQGPCRAFLADLSGSNSQKTRNANALFSFFMALGNVLGYAAGSSTKLYKIFPFTMTHACDVYCANLKSCFFLSIALLGILTILALSTVHENVFVPENEGHDKEGKFGTLFWREMFGTFKGLPKPMWILILVTALNWIGWFPFLLYDTDWMGREIYGGTVGEGKMYDLGVRAGAMGLMINAGVLGVTSLAVVFLVRGVHSVKRLWGAANLLLAFCMVMTIMVSKFAESNRRFATTADGETTPLPPLTVIKAAALTIFAMLGIPLAVTFSVPFALASIFASKYGGAGQGLSLGVLNLAIVIPQMIVSVSSGPLDARFGGGNLPAFVVGAVAAAASGIVAFTMLPSLRSETTASDPVK